MKIPFNIPYSSGNEVNYINQVVKEKKYSAGGKFENLCIEELSKLTKAPNIKLTSSCTAALEICAIAINIKHGDEVILPSYTYVSTANAFALRGAKLIFVDVNPTTMCLDESLLEEALSKKTKAIVVVHYNGFTSNLKEIKKLCEKHQLFMVEDAAQSINSYYNNHHLGTVGDLGCFSFHDTKNIHCGEGGALLINNKKLKHKIDLIIEKGTNKADFLNNKVDAYTWKMLGSSYGLSELQAAFLYAQLKNVTLITKKRLSIYQLYEKLLLPLKEKGYINFSEQGNRHNAHFFFIKANKHITALTGYLNKKGISAYSHYQPLHLSEMGRNYTFIKHKTDITKLESNKLLRLPIYYDLSPKEVKYICQSIHQFYQTKT